MISDDDSRAKSGGMQFGSTQSGLFSTGGADPRVYVGAPAPRRCRTPAGDGSSKSRTHTPSSKPFRPSPSPSPARAKTSHSQRSPSAQGTTPAPAMRAKDGLLIGAVSGSRSILDFDPNIKYEEGDILLDSPRSVRACLQVGLTALDLVAISYHECLEQMKRNGETVSDSQVCKMRYQYFCDRRKRSHKMVIEERDRIIADEISRPVNSEARKNADQSTVDNSTMVQNEERRLQKIVDTNLSRLRQQLLHRELLQRQRAKEDARLHQSRREAEQRKADEIKFLAEKSRKEEEAQSLRNEARELDRMKQAAEIELKRAKYEEKDLQVKERMRKTQVIKEAMNEAKQRHNMERRRQMKEQAELVLKKRRSDFEVRWEKFEQDRVDYKDHLKDVAARRRAEAEMKEEKIEAAIERCELNLQAKIQRTYDREAKAQAMLREHRDEREAEKEAEREREAMKERRRQQTYADAQLQLQERSVKFTNRIRQAEGRLRQAAEEKAEQMRLQHEVQRETELDKKNCVERSKKIDEARRIRLQANIDRKNARADADKEKRELLAARRKLHREEVERSRVHIPDVTPGPGDYLVTEGNVGTEGAKWKFGLPASVMGLRTIIRGQPPPGYDPSPGPGVYQADTPFYARHRRAPSSSFGKHDRWTGTANSEVTPGPADYAPKRDDPLLEAHQSKQRARSAAS